MHIRRVVDLSLPIDSSTQVYPGDPAVSFRSVATLERDGFNLLGVEMGSQTGTNCDAPYHFSRSGASIDEVPLDRFIGPGVVIDVRGKPPRTAITAADIDPYLSALSPGSVAVFHTGWSHFYQTPGYFDHPYLDAGACQVLLDRGVRTFGLDTQSIDETPDANHSEAGYPVHRMIAAAGGVIVENLARLEDIDFADPLIAAFPLRLTGADGSPARAVALDLDVGQTSS